MIQSEALREYADRLEQAGFTIYESTFRGGSKRYFRYSRMVDGRECFGYVQHDWVGSGFEHSMPIRPSIENGSSMWIKGVRGQLTVEAATKVASPKNWNPLVGWQANYNDPQWSYMYEKRTPAVQS